MRVGHFRPLSFFSVQLTNQLQKWRHLVSAVRGCSIAFLLLLLQLISTAQDSVGIRFENSNSWQQVLQKATAENKLVFVDLYTDWCVPCKRMEKEVFTQKAVADTFNRRFINYRLDAEKGDGIAVAKQYGVSGYPYFAFVDGSGRLYYSVLGYRDERRLLQDAVMATAEQADPKPYGVWQDEYAAKSNDPAWLQQYIQKRNKLRMDNTDLLDDYYSLLTPAEYTTPRNLALVIQSSGIKLNGKAFGLLAKHFASIPSQPDSLADLQTNVLSSFENALNGVFVKAIREEDEATFLQEVLPAYAAFPQRVAYMPWYQKQDGSKWKTIFYRQTADFQQFMPVATSYLNKYYRSLSPAQIRRQDSVLYNQVLNIYAARFPDTAQLTKMKPMLDMYFKTYNATEHLERLTNAASFVLEQSSNPKQLQQGLAWSRRALAIEENANTLALTAKLAYKLNQRKEALRLMQAAVSKSPDDKALLQLLNQMKAGGKN